MGRHSKKLQMQGLRSLRNEQLCLMSSVFRDIFRELVNAIVSGS
jgi:hypothetical protein